MGFKDWAYAIARQYCPEGKMDKPRVVKAPPRQGCRYASEAEIARARRGLRVNLSTQSCFFVLNPGPWEH